MDSSDFIMGRLMTRRNFIVGAGTFAVGALLAGCSSPDQGSGNASSGFESGDQSDDRGETASDATANDQSQMQQAPASDASSQTQTQTQQEGLGRILLAYFSRPGENNYGTGTHVDIDVGYTQSVAGYMQDALGYDTFRIVESDTYPHSYSDTVRRNVEKEQANARPAIANLSQIPDMSVYDTIILGSPIWNSQPPMIMRTFLEAFDLSGKTIYPFCTYDMSRLGSTISVYRSTAPEATVSDKGLAVYECDAREDAGRQQAIDWLRSIGALS